MSTSKARKLGTSSPYTPPDPPSFLSFLYSPMDFATRVVTSKRTHLNLLRLALLSLLGIASLVVSAGGYGVLWFSWGKVSGWEGNMQLHYGTPSSPPHSLISLPDVSRFTENQAYDVYVDLTLPVTRSNVNLGNFMVHLSLLPSFSSLPLIKGRPSPSYSALSPPPALYSSTLPTLLAALPPLSPFNLLSLVFHTPKKTITLKMLDGVVLVPSSKKAAETVKMVRVWVGREDLWKSLGDGKNGGSGREVVTLGGKVRIVGKLSGIRALLAHHPLLSLLTFTTTSLLTTLFFSLLAFYLLSPTSPTTLTTSSTPSAPSPLPPSPKLNLSRAREREWAAQLPRGMGDITGEGGAHGLMDSSEEERMLKQEEEEEEEEWDRLKGLEAGRLREEEERERLEELQREEEEVSSGEETAGGRAVEVKREDEEDGEEARSLLGGSGTTPSHRSWGASTSRSSAPSGSSASTRPSRS
ncbi:putative adipose-regulatory protein-domain-containing protein [Mrakia frigida]|uniref:putative adipose-regulatory protein-domain-containing protein n=1 Tax=Mrakia frigida TaxID=29902 RepID=UPI003FCBF28B